MPDNIVHHTGNWITDHPYASAGIAVGTLVIVWYLMSGSSATTAAASTDTTGAADVVAAQLAANEQLAATNAQAGVTNNQTSAAQTVALAQVQAQTDATTAAAQVTDNQTAAAQAVALASIQGQTDAAVASSTAIAQSAQFNALAEVANSNASVINTMTNASAAEQLSNNATLQSEFGNLGYTLSNMFNSGGSAAIEQAAVSSFSAPSNRGAQTGVVEVVGSMQSFLKGFTTLASKLGVGITAPVSQAPTQAGALSLAQINTSAISSAVNGWSAHA